MSQRMDEFRWARFKGKWSWDGNEREEIREELTRARSEEARLLEENRKQAETIKALADALESVKRRGLAADDVYEQVNAALRQAGRLP